MGTSSLTLFHDLDENSDQPLLTVYQQYDGYPRGVGKQIKDCLGSKIVVSGFRNPKTEVNGCKCAAAMYVAHAKEPCAGNVYIYPADTINDFVDYVYHVFVGGGKDIRLTVEYMTKVIYDGSLDSFDPEEVERKHVIGT